METPPTQTDIARALGISTMAVSLALRNSPEISESLQQKVSETAQQMGYQINPYAKLLVSHRRGKSMQGLPLALINLWDPPKRWERVSWCRMIHEGCTRRAEELGFHIDVIHLKSPGMTVRRANQILKSRGIRGVLVTPVPTPYSNSHLSLDWDYFSAVAIGYTLRRPNLHRVASNLHMSMHLTLRQLKQAGYRRIGLQLDENFVRRMDGIPDAAFLLYQKDVSPKNQVPILRTDFDHRTDGLAEWLERYRPDVILTYWIDVYSWLVEAGYSVPEDIGFVILQWSEELCERIGREPTGVTVENKEIGAKAVDLVVGGIAHNAFGVPESPTITLIAPRWVAGETIQTSRVKK